MDSFFDKQHGHQRSPKTQGCGKDHDRSIGIKKSLLIKLLDLLPVGIRQI